VIFVSCKGFLLDGNTQTGTSGTSLDDTRYNRIMDLLTEERHSRSKLEVVVARELLALRQEIAKCQCANGKPFSFSLYRQHSSIDTLSYDLL
jgi:hypothetical protein